MPVSTWLVMYEDNVSYNIIHNINIIIHVYKSTIHLTLYIRAHDTKRRTALCTCTCRPKHHLNIPYQIIHVPYSLCVCVCVCVCVYCMMAGVIVYILHVHVLYSTCYDCLFVCLFELCVLLLLLRMVVGLLFLIQLVCYTHSVHVL